MRSFPGLHNVKRLAGACMMGAGILLSNSSWGATASAVDLEKLTLPDARKLMLERNRELQLARHAVAGAEAEITIAGARPNPTLNVGAAHIGSASGPDAAPFARRIDTSVGVSQLFERGRKREL